MSQLITDGVLVEVKLFYDSKQSNAGMNEYVYAYEILIENRSDFPFKLLSRRWEITDGLGNKRIVEGEGVVGKQPYLEPGQQFIYTSHVAMRTDLGKMEGYYTIMNLRTNLKLEVRIPTFSLIPPFKYN